MRISAIKTKAIKKIFLIAGALFFFSCVNNGKRSENNITNPENPIIKQELLIGSWKDTSQSALHFTLFNDGTARSDNMKTLLYKKWIVKENQITFTVESVGNGISSTDNVTYFIDKLTDNELILRKGTYISKYKKE